MGESRRTTQSPPARPLFYFRCITARPAADRTSRLESALEVPAPACSCAGAAHAAAHQTRALPPRP
eukprot:scaffold3853_cov118-Isochrysis_galbana.AAC.4